MQRFLTGLAGLLVSVLPSVTFAFFGNDSNLQCKAQKSCDGSGNCAPTDRKVLLSIKNLTVSEQNDDRFWPVRLGIDGVVRDVDMVTESGPILWGEGLATVNFLYLLVDGEKTGLIWQRNDFGEGTTQLLFLSCEEARN